MHADALAHHQVHETPGNGSATRTLVGCGECLPGQNVVIVDPQTRQPCGEGNVGEIWVQGRSVARGYYGWPEATQTAFGARLATGEGPFLRTGDLGFLRAGQLFVTGRRKDVIIIRGRNYYPEDIERSVERAHDAFRAGHCAAFSVDVEDRERLVVVQEIEPRRRHLDADAPLRAIRRAIASDHELEVHAIVLAKAAAIPKTSSGKTRRSACRERYLSGQLPAIAPGKPTARRPPRETAVARSPRRAHAATRAEIESWLIERIAARLRLPAAQLHVDDAFHRVRHGFRGCGGDCRGIGVLAGPADLAHGDLQLPEHRRLGAVAVQLRCPRRKCRPRPGRFPWPPPTPTSSTCSTTCGK